MSKKILREQMEWAFRGEFPEVAIASGINLDEITAKDGSPFFVTLPAMRVGTSENMRYYSPEVVADAMRQIVQERPAGIMGHLPDEKRGTDYPMPEVYWVGAAMVDEVLWVKGYVPPGRVADMLKSMKVTQSKVALSVYGMADQTWNNERGTLDISEFDLEQIDFAPPKRSGFGMDVVPHITTEMDQPEPEEENPMDKNQILEQLTAEDARLLPAVVRSAIAAAAPEAALVGELRQALGLDDNGDLAQAVKEMAATVAKIKREAITAEISLQVAENILAEAKGDSEAVQAVRGIAISLVEAQQPASVEAVKPLVLEVAKRPQIMTLVEQTIISEMGPNTSRQNNKTDGKADWEKFLQPLPADQA